MARTVVLTEAATQRFEKALLDWWILSGNGGKPGADKIAAALNCDRRTIMRLRNRQPNDRNLLVALFAAQAKNLPSSDHLTLWNLKDADFEETQIVAQAGWLLTEAGQLYQGANYDLAEKRCREALTLYQQTGAKGGQATAHHIMGQIEIARGRFDPALEHLECGLALNRGLKNNWLTADLHELRGTLFLRRGDWNRSREDYTASLALWRQAKNLQASADLEINLVGLETRANCVPQARTHLENARKLIEAMKDAPPRASLMLQEARLLLREGQPEAAEKCANKALDYWTFAEHPRWKALSHLVLAEIAAKQNHDAAAAQQAELSLKLYEQAGDQYGAAQARQILAANRA